MKNPNMQNSNKIFIGGLSTTTTQSSFQEYFEKYGALKDCVLMREKESGRSRGFGFVVFKNSDDVSKILDAPNHYLDGKRIDCKKAVPKEKGIPQKPQRSSQPLSSNLKNKEKDGALQIKSGQMNRMSGRILTSTKTDNPFSIAMPLPNEPVMTRGSMGTSGGSQLTLASSLQRGSNSYFPNHQNRFSSMSHKCNEISEANEEKSNPESIPAFDSQIAYQSKIPQRHSLQGNTSTSLFAAESEETKAGSKSRKIFVGGLPHGVTEDGVTLSVTETEFTQYFAQYGEIEDSVIIHDRETGKPRGFGFVTYKTEQSVDFVLRDKMKHKIKGKWVECKRATPKALANEGSAADTALPSYTYLRAETGVKDNTYKQCPRKFSVESMRFSDVLDQKPKRHSQLNNDNPFALQNNSDNDKEDKSGSVKSENEIKSENNCKFSSLIKEKTVLPPKNKMKWKNDNINTYANIFEDGHESDNGSDWKFSTNDPLMNADQGFPSTLPYSDFGTIFTVKQNLEEDKQNVFQLRKQKFAEDRLENSSVPGLAKFHKSGIPARESDPSEVYKRDSINLRDFEVAKELPKMERNNVAYGNRKSLPIKDDKAQKLEYQPEKWLDNVLEDSPFS